MQNNTACTNPVDLAGSLNTCTRCNGWRSSSNDPAWRCDDCSGHLDRTRAGLMRYLDQHGLCFCGLAHQGGILWGRCACICTCEDEDRLLDPDYEDGEESDDNLEENLAGRAAEGEQNFARTYGWQTNVILNEGTDSERRLFHESPGHMLVAQSHDIGIPAESSLPNSENGITQIEDNGLTSWRGEIDGDMTYLPRDLDPWEFAALEQTSGLSRSELLERFPEAREFQFSDPASVELQPVRRLLCRQCLKQSSPGAMQALNTARLTFCGACHMIEKPESPANDPDQSDFEAGIPGTMDNCYCRCQCQPEDKPPLNEGTTVLMQLEHGLYTIVETQYRLTQEALRQLDLDQQMGPQLAEAGEAVQLFRENAAQQRRQRLLGANNLDHSSIDSPMLRAPLRIGTNTPQADAEMEIQPASPSPLTLQDPNQREALRDLYDLPELRLSDNENLEQRTYEDVRNAMEDSELTESFDEPEDARNYLRAARALALMGGTDEDHPTLNHIRNAIAELDERICDREMQQ